MIDYSGHAYVDINWTLTSFAEGVEHMIGKKIIPKPRSWSGIDYNHYSSYYKMQAEFFDDGTVLATVSDWDCDYYGSIDAAAPLFYFGVVQNLEKYSYGDKNE